LLDIGLPGMDGNQLARHLRALPEAKSAFMVAITGYGNEFDKESSMQAGFDEYVVKPADPNKIVTLLAKVHKA
jgi:CheY-like chemotaxis protein